MKTLISHEPAVSLECSPSAAFVVGFRCLVCGRSPVFLVSFTDVFAHLVPVANSQNYEFSLKRRQLQFRTSSSVIHTANPFKMFSIWCRLEFNC